MVDAQKTKNKKKQKQSNQIKPNQTMYYNPAKRFGGHILGELKQIFKLLQKLDKTPRANLFNFTVLPAMLYANEMWAKTKKEEQRLDTIQRALKRSMLEILLR